MSRSMNKLSLIILTIIIFLIAIGLFFRGATDLLAQWHYQKGLKFEQEGILEWAQDEFSAGLALNPDSALYQKLAGVLYGRAFQAEDGKLKKELLTQSLGFINQAIEVNPHSSSHYYSKGRILSALGMRLGAVESFRYAIELDEFNHPEYYLDLAVLYLGEEDFDQADQVVSSGLVHYPDEIVNFYIKQEKDVASQFEVSIEEIDLGYLDKLYRLYQIKGFIAVQKGNYQGAERFFKKALKIKGGE